MRARVDAPSRPCVALLVALVVAPAVAQDDSVPRAPRLAAPATASAAPAAAIVRGPLSPPSATRLAPLPEERATAPEEIIVIGQGWRLPDLGSRWREKQREAAGSARFHATALPLYDPARPPQHSDSLWLSPETKRHGYIELFQLRFGRPKKTEAAESQP